MGVKLGEEVGYTIRFEDATSTVSLLLSLWLSYLLSCLLCLLCRIHKNCFLSLVGLRNVNFW